MTTRENNAQNTDPYDHSNEDIPTASTENTYPDWARYSTAAQQYYAEEWGKPLKDEQDLYELIALLGFQAGLSWTMILNKRASLRHHFHDFNPDIVANFGEDTIQSLLQDETMIRNRRKITAAITNAQATVMLRTAGGLVETIWKYQSESAEPRESVPELIEANPWIKDLAKELKREGFTQIGPRLVAALLQAIGMIEPVPSLRGEVPPRLS